MTSIDRGVVEALCRPFFKDGVQTVYLGICCNRVFAGKIRPVKCRTCSSVPEVFEARKEPSDSPEL